MGGEDGGESENSWLGVVTAVAPVVVILILGCWVVALFASCPNGGDGSECWGLVEVEEEDGFV